MVSALASRLRARIKSGGSALCAQLLSDPIFTGVFVALWLCALVPLWAPRFLPLLDLPDHLDAIAIWHRYHDSSWGYSRYYDLNLMPVPYWGYFLPVHLMSYLLPIEVANKVYLSAYALLLPTAVLLLARQMERSRWLALFAFPLVYNMNFSYGFITFCAGVVVMLFALVALDRFLSAPSRRRGIALGLLTLLLYTTHVLPWMFFGVASVVLAFCHGWHPRRVGAAFVLELPSLVLALYAFRVAGDGTTAVQAGPLTYLARGELLLTRLQQVPLRILVGWPDSRPYLVLIGLGLVWLALLLTARDEPGTERRGFAYRLELLALLAVAAYLLLPMHLLKPIDLWMIGGRFLMVVALLGALLPRGELVGRRRLWMVPVVLLAAYYPLALAQKWVQFDRRAASFRRLMRHVERGRSTLVLVDGGGGDPSVDPNALPYLQFHAYAQYLAGGYDAWSMPSGFPAYPKPGAALPAPRWKHLETFSFDKQGIYYDYILTKGEWTDHLLFGPDDAARAPLVASDGDWRLYSVRHP